MTQHSRKGRDNEIGIALGARAITTYADWWTIVSTQAIVLSFGVSAMVDPIEALRYG